MLERQHNLLLWNNRTTRANQLAQKGKSLSYVPLTTKQGKIVVNIVAKDLKFQESYWRNALIGFMTGDTPYMKTMENYIAHTSSFASKP